MTKALTSIRIYCSQVYSPVLNTINQDFPRRRALFRLAPGLAGIWLWTARAGADRLDDHRGPVAQLDRASDYESEGRTFESCRDHH